MKTYSTLKSYSVVISNIIICIMFAHLIFSSKLFYDYIYMQIFIEKLVEKVDTLLHKEVNT